MLFIRIDTMEYCEIIEGIVHYVESLGEKYYSVTPSYVPALAKRLAPLEKLRSK